MNGKKWENLSQLITDRILSLVSRSKVMIEMSKTFPKFQLVLNFVLFFTLTLFFSVHEKYKLAKIWGGSSQGSPSFYGPAMESRIDVFIVWILFLRMVFIFESFSLTFSNNWIIPNYKTRHFYLLMSLTILSPIQSISILSVLLCMIWLDSLVTCILLCSHFSF